MAIVPAAIPSLDVGSFPVPRVTVARLRPGYASCMNSRRSQCKALAKGVWVGGRIFMVCVMGAIVAGVFAAGLGTIAAVLGILVAS